MKVLYYSAALFVATAYGGLSASSHDHVFQLKGRTVSPDFTCGLTGGGNGTEGYTCPTTVTPCCSASGYCGNGTDYCATAMGCQSAYGTCNTTVAAGSSNSNSSNTCGPNIGTCADTECCSDAGFCGTGESYCEAPLCQFDYGPACDANITPSGANTSTIARPLNGDVLYGSAGIYDCIDNGTMALTFDDGPYIYTSHILDLLEQYNASATFFITGNNNGKGQIDNTSLAWPALIQRAYAAGHQIASHTWSHPSLSNVSAARRRDEMYRNEMALRNILGVIPTYMRPPYSDCTEESGCEQDMVDLGYHITYFNLDTQDYLNDSPTLINNSVSIFDAAVNASVVDQDEFLVISHDIHNQTSKVLVEHMLQVIQSKGYRPVTVGECLGDPMANWYRNATSATEKLNTTIAATVKQKSEGRSRKKGWSVRPFVLVGFASVWLL